MKTAKILWSLCTLLLLTACAGENALSTASDIDRYRLTKLDEHCKSRTQTTLSVIDHIHLNAGESYRLTYYKDGRKIGHSGSGPATYDQILSQTQGPETRNLEGMIMIHAEAGKDRRLKALVSAKPDTRTLLLVSDEPINMLSLRPVEIIKSNGLYAAIIDQTAATAFPREALCFKGTAETPQNRGAVNF